MKRAPNRFEITPIIEDGLRSAREIYPDFAAGADLWVVGPAVSLNPEECESSKSEGFDARFEAVYTSKNRLLMPEDRSTLTCKMVQARELDIDPSSHDGSYLAEVIRASGYDPTDYYTTDFEVHEQWEAIINSKHLTQMAFKEHILFRLRGEPLTSIDLRAEDESVLYMPLTEKFTKTMDRFLGGWGQFEQSHKEARDRSDYLRLKDTVRALGWQALKLAA